MYWSNFFTDEEHADYCWSWMGTYDSPLSWESWCTSCTFIIFRMEDDEIVEEY